MPEVNLCLTLGMARRECEVPAPGLAVGCPNPVGECRDSCAATYNFSQNSQINTQKRMGFLIYIVLIAVERLKSIVSK
jgi:hypothetical protein